jgi:hypothetical protein
MKSTTTLRIKDQGFMVTYPDNVSVVYAYSHDPLKPWTYAVRFESGMGPFTLLDPFYPSIALHSNGLNNALCLLQKMCQWRGENLEVIDERDGHIYTEHELWLFCGNSS